MWNSMAGWMGGWEWFGLMHLVWWALVIAVAVILFRGFAGERRGGDRSLQILRERYARGEIDRTEYDERMRALVASS